MTDQFVAEIRIFGFNFAPTGWATCDGQLLPISQNTALFALLGTTYGGDGKSTFALPDLGGSAPMHPGQGQGLSLRDLGEIGGSQNVTLLQTEMPIHTHTVFTENDTANTNVPTGNYPAVTSVNSYGPVGNAAATFAPNTLSVAGGSQPHNNMQPYLTLMFCIALQGIFPPRG